MLLPAGLKRLRSLLGEGETHKVFSREEIFGIFGNWRMLWPLEGRPCDLVKRPVVFPRPP